MGFILVMTMNAKRAFDMIGNEDDFTVISWKVAREIPAWVNTAQEWNTRNKFKDVQFYEEDEVENVNTDDDDDDDDDGDDDEEEEEVQEETEDKEEEDDKVDDGINNEESEDNEENDEMLDEEERMGNFKKKKRANVS